MRNSHRWNLRVYYEDTDAAGIVYYANYLKYAERARTEALREAGSDHSRLREEQKLSFVVRHVSADYKRPARLDDLLTIETTLDDIRGASIRMRQTVRRGEDILVVLGIKLGMVGENLQPARIPDAVRTALLSYFS